jgi:hypothetical protein
MRFQFILAAFVGLVFAQTYPGNDANHPPNHSDSCKTLGRFDKTVYYNPADTDNVAIEVHSGSGECPRSGVTSI